MNIILNEKYNRFFLNWLIFMILLIALMIVVGGLTRLTDSGLSITKWQLFSGIIPPITEKDWIHWKLAKNWENCTQKNTTINPQIALSITE